jgi:SAM-dependent methyltransferase
MLFVELALIRWLGEQVLYLSFFSNFVLLGSFLGIGIGFLRSGRGKPWFPYSPMLLAILIGFAAAFPVEVDRSGSSLIFFGDLERSGLPTWVMLPIIFVAVALVLAAIADGVARTFQKFEPLEAYRLDIGGSVLGTVGFSVLALLSAPPFVWGIVAAVLFALLLDLSASAIRFGVVAVAILAIPTFAGDHTWSAYYDIETRSTGTSENVEIQVLVNGIPHQYIAEVDARLERNAGYFWPYQQWASDTPPEEVLIVGAGTGSDVAVALHEGVGHIDAVEIDRALYEIGLAKNPDRPYDDPRVDVIIDDGRAYLERTDKTYDLILFALPDSLTLVSGQSSLRLESFLFTKEALEAARDRLKPGGVFSMYNFYREQWLIDRLARTLDETFNTAPCVRDVRAEGAVAVLTVSSDPTALDCDPSPEVSAAGPAPVTDDYPFLYLREPGIPAFYGLAVAGILLASLLGIRASGARIRQMAPYTDLFLMGAAFLLLETKNVVQFALLFGTTWIVNALVFAGILLTVLAAIEVARRVRLPRPGMLYTLLFVALAVAWVVPQSSLLDLNLPMRFVVGSVLAFSPIFIANVVFAQRFRDTANSTAAFGANLLGAMVGGILEYASLIVGYRALLIAAAVIYLGAYAVGRRHLLDGSLSRMPARATN